MPINPTTIQFPAILNTTHQELQERFEQCKTQINQHPEQTKELVQLMVNLRYIEQYNEIKAIYPTLVNMITQAMNSNQVTRISELGKRIGDGIISQLNILQIVMPKNTMSQIIDMLNNTINLGIKYNVNDKKYQMGYVYYEYLPADSIGGIYGIFKMIGHYNHEHKNNMIQLNYDTIYKIRHKRSLRSDFTITPTNYTREGVNLFILVRYIQKEMKKIIDKWYDNNANPACNESYKQIKALRL